MFDKRRIKLWAEKWLLSDHLKRLILLRRFPHRLQKFWLGSPPLQAPAFEKGYFDKAGLPSKVVRRQDDYRSAGVIQKRAMLPLEGLRNCRTVQFAVTPEGGMDSLRDKTVRFKWGEQEKFISDIPDDQWFDVRLDFKAGDGQLVVETEAPIAITMPRGVISSKGNNSRETAQHVIILVLDAWTSSVADQDHPFTGEETVFPNIKRFFSEGLQAKNGVSSGQWTLPSVGSLFTGQHLAGHRMFHPKRWQEFDLKRKTLPEYFQQAGYHTLCGSVVSRVTPAFGHNRGFDRFLYHFVDPQLSSVKYDPALWIQEIIGHLEAHYHDATFSYFQFPDTHPSWHLAPETRYFQLGRRGNTSGDLRKMLKDAPDEKFDLPEQAKQMYLLRLAELDRMLGCLFDYVERHFGEKAIVIVTADHGLRMPYLSSAHKDDEPFLTDVRVNIPLYVRGNDIPRMDYGSLCSPNIDIPVMLLQLAGIKSDTDDLDGVDVSTQQENGRGVISEYIYNNIYEIAVRGEDHALFLKYDMDDVNFKFLSRHPRYEGLYRLNEEDYSPQNNLITQKPDVAERLRKVATDHFVQKGIQGE